MAHVTRWSAAACLPLACLALAASAEAQIPDACAGAQQPPTAKTIPAARAATLCLINGERAAYGLRPLVEAPVVGWTAQTHSDLMVLNKFFAHSKGVAQMLRGVYWAFGQNIAWADGRLAAPEMIVAAWMASAAHRRNILGADYDHIGIGIATGAPEVTPLPAATYTTDFGAATAREKAQRGEDAEREAKGTPEPGSEAPAPADTPESDSRVTSPAVAPPGAERRMRPSVRLPRLKPVKVCSAKARAARRRGRIVCVKRRPRITIKTRRDGGGATSFLVPDSR